MKEVKVKFILIKRMKCYYCGVDILHQVGYLPDGSQVSCCIHCDIAIHTLPNDGYEIVTVI